MPQFFLLEYLTCAPEATPYDLAFCTLVALLLFTVHHLLLSQTSGNRKYLLALGTCGSVLALLLMSVAPAGTLDLDLTSASADVSQQVSHFLSRSLHWQQPFVLSASSLCLALAIFAGLLTSSLGIPAYEYARCYHTLLTAQCSETSVPQRLLLHANFFLPLLAAVCWVPPLTTDLLCGEVPAAGSEVAASAASAIATCQQRIVGGRLLLVAACAFLRLCLLRTHVQARYNSEAAMAQRNLAAALAMAPPPPAKGAAAAVEAPLGVQVLAETLQTRHKLLCWRALQYVAPALIQLSLVLMLKNRVRYDLGCAAWLPGADWLPQRFAASSARSAANMAKVGEAMGAGAKLKMFRPMHMHTPTINHAATSATA